MQRYIEKANLKFEMISVKKMKAVWYHGMNEYHKIKPGGSFNIEHIIALICYTDISHLCTAFRETYRRKDQNELLNEQIERHQMFAHMGRLLYESFVFYASKDSKIQILYHGMSTPLVFATLYASFDVPTSTTTAS
eukprot:255561_1